MAEIINTNKYLNYDGLVTLWGKIKDSFATKAVATTTTDGLMSSADKLSLDALVDVMPAEKGAQVNVIEGVAVRGNGKSAQLPVMKVDGQDYSVSVLDVETDLTKVSADVDPLHVASAYGVKSYVESVVADKNVAATGDSLVGATASSNTVSVFATDDLKSAVNKASSAVQGATSSSSYLSASAANNTITVGLSVATGITGAVAGTLADAKDVKDYADAVLNDAIDAVNNKNVGATSTSDYLSATAANNTVTVGLSVAAGITGAVAGTLADAKDVKDYADVVLGDAKSYTDGKAVGVTSSTPYFNVESTGNLGTTNTIAINATIGKVEGEAATAGLAEATDVRSYVDGAIADVKSLVSQATQFLGVSTVEITDGATTPTKIGDVTVGSGDIVIYNTDEFIWDGGKWVLLGNTTAEGKRLSDLEDRAADLEDIVGDGITDTTLTDATVSLLSKVGAGITGTDLTTEVNKLKEGTGTVKSFAGADGDITIDDTNATAGDVKFTLTNKKLTAKVNGWSELSTTANSAIQEVNSGDYISVTSDATDSTKVTVNAVANNDLSTVTSTTKALADAYAVKSYVDGKINDINYSDVTYANPAAAVTMIPSSITQSAGKIEVKWNRFEALSTADITAICVL